MAGEIISERRAEGRLPRVSPNVLSGLMETIAADSYGGRADLPHLATSLQMEVDDLFPVAETLQLLRFTEISEGDIRLADPGKRFVHADVDERKRLFSQHLLSYVPLAGHIKRVLDERSTHRAPASRFRDELEDYMSEASADTTLRAIISWARYGGPTKRTVGCLALRNRPDSEPATPPAARSEIQALKSNVW